MTDDNIAHDRGDGPRHPVQLVTTPSGSVYAQMTPPPGARPATNLVLDLVDALKLKLAEAMSIIGHAVMLRQSGSAFSSPGWASFDHRADEFMRVTPRQSRDLPVKWEPQSSDGSPVPLSEAIGQAIGSASMAWDNVGAAGVFDDAWAGKVYEGLMAYLDDWADQVRRNANQSNEAARLEKERW